MKKFYSLLLVLLMAVMSVGTAKASAIFDRGDGWWINMDGLLNIDNPSLCQDYSSASETPWYQYKNIIKEVWIDGYFHIGKHMFEGYPSLKYVWIYNNDDEGSYDIHDFAFKDCPLFEGGTFNACHSIGESAFENCTKMELLPLGGNIRTIGKKAFKGCTKLDFVYVGNGLTTIEESAFEGCTTLDRFDLSMVRYINDKAFKDCPLGNAIDLSNIKTIGAYAFQNCGLASVSLGANLTSLGNYAFSSGICSGADLYMNSTNPPTLGSYAFNNVVYSSVTLHVPSSAKANYSGYPWNQFIPAERESEIYGKWDDSNNVLTLYYGDSYTVADARRDWNESAYICNYATKIVITHSVSMAKPTSAMNMFAYFSNVTKIEGLEYLNTSQVTNMKYMFQGCSSLQSIHAEFLNTSNVTDMTGMFALCSELKSIDVSNFDMSKVTITTGMFSGCTKLEKIQCNKDWSAMSNITTSNNMFYNCTSLVGGWGSPFDASHVNVEYARPDGGIDAPGYFWKAGDTGEAPEDPVDPQEGIDQTSQEPKANSQKLIRDGQLLILVGDKTYDARGAEVK